MAGPPRRQPAVEVLLVERLAGGELLQVGLDALARLLGEVRRIEVRGPVVFGRELRRRRDRHRLHGVQRALRLRIEEADGVDGVAEEVDPHGALRRRREDVEYPAPAAHVAGHFHRRLHAVAHAGPTAQGLHGVEPAAAADGVRQPRHVLGVQGLRRESVGRSDKQRWRAPVSTRVGGCAQCPKGRHALGDGAAIGRQPLVGSGVELGEHVGRSVLARVGQCLFVEEPCRLRPRHDDGHRTPQAAPQRGKEQGLGGVDHARRRLAPRGQPLGEAVEAGRGLRQFEQSVQGHWPFVPSWRAKTGLPARG